MTTVTYNYLLYVVNQLIHLSFSIITIPYVARVLGAENLGLYSYTYSIASYFVMFITLGLNNYGIREIAQCKNNKKLLNTIFSEIYIMQLICGISMLCLYIIYFFIFIKDDKVIYIIQAIYIFSGIIDINWALQGLEFFKFISIKGIILNIINALCIFLFVNNINDLFSYAFFLSLSAIINNILSWIYIYNKINIVKITIDKVTAHIRPNLILFIPILAVSFYKIMDKIMLGILSNLDQVCFYEFSEKLIKIPMVFITSLGIIMLPRLSKYIINYGISEQIYELIKNSIDFVIITSSFFCFIIMSVSNEFVILFLGEGYITCDKINLLLLPTCIFLAFANVIRTQYLIPAKKDKEFIISVIAGAVINVIFNFLFIPKFGAIGAAIGTFITELCVCIVQCIYVKNVLPVLKFFLRGVPFIFMGLLTFLVVYPMYFHVNIFILLVIKFLIAVILYISCLTVVFIFNKKIYKSTINIIQKKLNNVNPWHDKK